MKRAAFALLLLVSSNTNRHAQALFYMPGNPNFIVQNMTGGGGLIAANYV
jgi:hypothetical protein